AVVTAAACACATLAFAMSTIGLWPLLVAMFVFGGLAFTVYPVSIALANDFLEPEEVLQGASSMLFIHGIGAAIGPTLAGLLMDLAGPRGLLLHFAVIHAALTTLVWWRYWRSGTVNAPQAHFETMIRTSPTALEMIAAETPAASDPAPADRAT